MLLLLLLAADWSSAGGGFRLLSQLFTVQPLLLNDLSIYLLSNPTSLTRVMKSEGGVRGRSQRGGISGRSQREVRGH